MAHIELVVTDLDGTLWDGGEAVHARTVAALAELEHRRIPLLVATGRRRRSAARALGGVGLQPPAVLLDGALGYHLASGVAFHRVAYRPDDARRTLDVFLDHGLQPCVYVDQAEVDCLVGAEPATHPRHLEALGRAVRRADLRRAVTSQVVVSFGIVAGVPEELAPVADAIAAVGCARPVLTRDVVYGAATLMVAPRGVSKWDGVSAYCAAEGLDPDRVLAVGDGHNDVELLSRARVACAVSDGCDAVLALAHHVVPPPHEGGWAQLLDLL
ncbi:MAG TPA: HAD family hydrolase [Nitriliruptorales bacterium]|nr:HAD family hydrolase [Nitriliruptorales bacterium]